MNKIGGDGIILSYDFRSTKNINEAVRKSLGQLLFSVYISTLI